MSGILIAFFISPTFQRRNDREEIRRRLAMGNEDDYLSKNYAVGAGAAAAAASAVEHRPSRKPSLQSRLQSGKSPFVSHRKHWNESPVN